MAKPISFTKRDLEKKKQEKRLAKQQKKEVTAHLPLKI